MPIVNCKIDPTAEILHPELVNLYGCEIGAHTRVGPFVEIQKGVKIGSHCKIQSHTFICSHVTIGNDCFIGHGVMFIDDTWPRARGEWTPKETHIKDGASIGSNATILPVTIGHDAMVGAGSVVTRDVRDYTLVVGNPSRTIKYIGRK